MRPLVYLMSSPITLSSHLRMLWIITQRGGGGVNGRVLIIGGFAGGTRHFQAVLNFTRLWTNLVYHLNAPQHFSVGSLHDEIIDLVNAGEVEKRKSGMKQP